jgi:hypothetical protein
MSGHGGKKRVRVGFIGVVFAAVSVFLAIIKLVSYFWTADQIAYWVAGMVTRLSSTTAWVLSVALGLTGIALIAVSRYAASSLTKVAGSKAVRTVFGAGVLALSTAFALGVFASRHVGKRPTTIASGPPPTPEQAPPNLLGSPSPSPKEGHTPSRKLVPRTQPASGGSQAAPEDISTPSPEQGSPSATVASCAPCESYTQPTEPEATAASSSEESPSAHEPEESGESSPESTTSASTSSNSTSTVASSTTASSTSAESGSDASASSSVTVNDGSVSVVTTNSSVDVSSNGVSVTTPNDSIDVSASGEATIDN